MITERAEIVADERWLVRRDVFDLLYSLPRAIPFLHVPCARGPGAAQYLRRADEGGVVCPRCGRALAADLMQELGIGIP